MKTKLNSVLLALALICTASTADAQLGKLFKKKGKKDDKKDEVVEKPREYSAHHKANMGKVVFYNTVLGKGSSGDSETGVITERTLASDDKPFYFRAYFEKSYSKSCEGCDGMDIKYTLGGVSLTTKEVRKMIPAYYGRMASAMSFYDYDNTALGIPLSCGAGKYVNNYTLQEDTYRILLSKVKDQLKPGATLKLKVEVMATKGDEVGATLASGEIDLKVTDGSNYAQSKNCRCAKQGMSDEKIEKAVAEAFEFQFNDVTKVHKVVLNGRDLEVNGDSRGMYANIIYQRNDGIFLQIKRWIYFKKNGDGYSDKATIGKHVYYIPVSPTCAF